MSCVREQGCQSREGFICFFFNIVLIYFGSNLYLLGSTEPKNEVKQQQTKRLYKNVQLIADTPNCHLSTAFSCNSTFFFLSKILTLLPRLEHSGVILAHCSLCLLDSSDSSAPASQVARIISVCHHSQLIVVSVVETGLLHVGQAGLELLSSSDPPASVSQSAGVTAMSYCVWHIYYLFTYF